MNIKSKKNCKVLVLGLLMLTVGCRNIDCPLENTVLVGGKLYPLTEGAVATGQDSLLITMVGSDSLLSYQKTSAQIQFPLHYVSNRDTLLLNFVKNGRVHTVDSLFIHHENNIHFENIDCPPAIFSQLKSVTWSNQPSGRIWVDSVTISSPIVNYNETENLKIFVHYNN